MDHFDSAYSVIYGKKWKSIRAALLTKHKSVALVNNFADPVKTSNELELSGAINLKSLVEQKELVEHKEQVNLTTNRNNDDVIPGKSSSLISSFHECNWFLFQVY